MKIDTLAIAKELEEAGVPIKQAEAQTRVYAKVIEMVIEEQLVTKQDLAAAENRLLEKLSGLEKRLSEKMGDLEKNVNEKASGLEKRINENDKMFLKLENAIQSQTLSLTVRLGSMIAIGVGLLAAMKFFG